MSRLLKFIPQSSVLTMITDQYEWKETDRNHFRKINLSQILYVTFRNERSLKWHIKQHFWGTLSRALKFSKVVAIVLVFLVKNRSFSSTIIMPIPYFCIVPDSEEDRNIKVFKINQTIYTP